MHWVAAVAVAQVNTPPCTSCVSGGVGGEDSLILKLFRLEVTATTGMVEGVPEVFPTSSVCIASILLDAVVVETPTLV